MQNSNKSAVIWVVIALVVLVVVGYVVYYLRPGSETTPPSVGINPPAEDSVASVESDLKGMSVEGLDSELADIDKELQ